MKTIEEQAKEYSEKTIPREEIECEWEATKEFDKIGPTVKEYFKLIGAPSPKSNITISTWKLEYIADTLRQANNIYDTRNSDTSVHNRMVKSEELLNEYLKNNEHI